MTNLDSILKSRDSTLLTKAHLVKAMVFPVVVWIWELDYKESWVPKNWCFWTVVLEKTLESPLDCKEIQPVHPKGNQSWIFIGRTDVEAETPILWPPDRKNWLIWKYRDAGQDWRREEKGLTEVEMVGWITNSIDMSLGKLGELVMDREAWRAAVRGVTRHWMWLSDWTRLDWTLTEHLLHVRHCSLCFIIGTYLNLTTPGGNASIIPTLQIKQRIDVKGPAYIHWASQQGSGDSSPDSF